MPEFPPELLNEIIGYLWNDIPGLKACSLAHPTMTFPSQKRLFYSICLRAPRKRLNNLRLVRNEISGTSYDFWRLLVGSPHIAEYVQSLFVIIDYSPNYYRLLLDRDVYSSDDDQTESGLPNEGYELANGEPVGSALVRCVAKKTANPARRIYHDKYLLRCALLLHDVKAFILNYNDGWQYLSSKIHITLLHLMRLPSLLYVQLESNYPSALFNVAIGDNVKHLVLCGYPQTAKLFVLPRHPSSGPLYVDSLDIRHPSLFMDRHFEDPNCRIQTSRRRKLVVIADTYDSHAAVWTILQTCHETLEDFEFTPCEEVMYTDHSDNDPINLSKLTSLKRFAVHMTVTYDSDNHDFFDYTTFTWFNRILLPKDAPPVSQQLEEISIYYNGDDDVLPFLEDTIDILLDDRFKTLEKINISIGSGENGLIVVDVLNSSEPVAKLRSRGNMVVDVRACNRSLCFEPDVRWKTINWQRWSHVGVHDDCREVSPVW